MFLVLAVLTLTARADAPAMDHANCPLHAAHARKAEVDRRHAQATGVGAEGVHRFLVEKEGGTIRLEAARPGDAAARDRIRAHLREVAAAFAAGDFSTSEAIHGTLPASTGVLKARRSAIRYAFVETDAGGEIRVRTEDPEARAALHDFLRFQIRDHHTGDATR